MTSECLITKENIWKRIRKGDNLCTLSEEEEETAIHLSSKCSVSRGVAFASSLSIRLDILILLIPHTLFYGVFPYHVRRKLICRWSWFVSSTQFGF